METLIGLLKFVILDFFLSYVNWKIKVLHHFIRLFGDQHYSHLVPSGGFAGLVVGSVRLLKVSPDETQIIS